MADVTNPFELPTGLEADGDLLLVWEEGANGTGMALVQWCRRTRKPSPFPHLLGVDPEGARQKLGYTFGAFHVPPGQAVRPLVHAPTPRLRRHRQGRRFSW